jgi:predicted transcriptional regulator
MVPFSRLIKVDPDTELVDVINKMAQAEVMLLPVMEGEELVGSISQDLIRQYLQFKSATV